MKRDKKHSSTVSIEGLPLNYSYLIKSTTDLLALLVESRKAGPLLIYISGSQVGPISPQGTSGDI